MTYELAKQLKDAGFTFIQVSTDPLARRSDTLYAFGDGKSYYEPTLEELIEACGDIIVGFRRLVDFGWEVFYEEESLEEIFFQGITPEEAVAALWLELNKK